MAWVLNWRDAAVAGAGVCGGKGWNLGRLDRSAGVQSTLSWSHIKPLITYVLHSTLPLAGYPVPPGMEVLRRFSGRAYFDLTAMMWSNYDALGLSPDQYVRGLGGHQPLIDVPPGDPRKGPHGARRDRARGGGSRRS